MGPADARAAFQAQEVDVHFVAALSRFDRGDKSGSANYLDRAATVMKKQGVDNSSVKALAGRLRSGNGLKQRDLEQVFAQSHYAMADYHRGRANTLIAKNQPQGAGESMEAMAYHVERSSEWSGQPLTAEQKGEVSNLRATGEALRTGTGYLVKGSGYVVQGTGWVLGKGFGFLTDKGNETSGRGGSFMRGTGRGGETGSRWIEGTGNGIKRFGDWLLRR